jgi:hypothetical protein
VVLKRLQEDDVRTTLLDTEQILVADAGTDVFVVHFLLFLLLVNDHPDVSW